MMSQSGAVVLRLPWALYAIPLRGGSQEAPSQDCVQVSWLSRHSTYLPILSLNRLMFGTVLLSATPAIGPSLVQLGIGFLYILLAWLAHRRSRIACGFILLLSFFEVLIEVVLVIIIQGNYGFNFIIVLVAFILSYGGFRGANAIFTHYRNTHK